MSTPESATPDGPPRPARLRAAALGLLAIGAIIALVLVYRSGDGGSSEPGMSSASGTSRSEGVDPTETGPVVTSSAQSPSKSLLPSASDAASTSTTASESDAPQPTLAGVTVLITSQGWKPSTSSVEVVGAVQGIATETSTCTAIVRDGNGSIAGEGSVDGSFDGQGTSCGLITVPMAGKPAGNYSVTILFETTKGSATSAPVTVTLP